MEQFSSSDTINDLSFKETSMDQILSVFEDCHNYIYANEGVLKEKAFREMIKILFIKIHIEKHTLNNKQNFFKIDKQEYKDIFSGKCNKSFEKRIQNLYDMISKVSALNIWQGPLLSQKTMAYIVHRLQTICFKNISEDIAGQAFQTFIHHHQRGERGEFFTPTPVVELAVQMIKPKANEKIIDPACGSGGFLLNAIRHISKSMPYNKLSYYIKNNVHGIEFNPDVALAAKLLLEIQGGQESNIFCTNALTTKNHHGYYDVILTNPPFGRKGKVEDQSILENYDLGKKWIKSKINSNDWIMNKNVLCPQSPEVLFIEKCLNLLKPNGRMALVLPDGLLQNPSLGYVRHWIKSKASLIGVVSLPQETFVPFGTGVKTSLALFKKSLQKQNIFFSKIKNIEYDVKSHTNSKDPSVILKPHNNENKAHRKEWPSQKTNSDLNKVIEAFNKTNNKSTLLSWHINHDLLKERWDAEYYCLDDIKMINQLKSKHLLSDLVEIVKYKEKFAKNSQSIVKYVAISDIDRYGMKIAHHQSIHVNKLPSRASYKICKGDILVAISGANTGTDRQAIAFVSEEYEGAICSNGFAVLRNIKNINKYFLLAFFKTDVFTKQIRRMMTGHAIPCLSLTNLSRVIVPIPNKNLQEKIAKKTENIIYLSQEAHLKMSNLQKEMTLPNLL